LIAIHEETLEKPKALLKTKAKELLIAKFYEQYTKKYDTWDNIKYWVDFTVEIDPDIKDRLMDSVAYFIKEVFVNPIPYLQDLKGQILAYVIAPGVLVYDLPEVYYVPDLHSKAKIAPVAETSSVIHKMMGAIAGKNIAEMFQAYHEAMLYGELTGDDRPYSPYTAHHWLGLNKMLEGNPKVRQVLEQRLDLIRKDGFTIEAIGKHLTPFIEKNLKLALSQGL